MIKKIKLLVICSRNKKRSLTAEKMYKKDQRVEIRSVGTSPHAKRKVTEADVRWADLILCMEDKHRKIIKQLFAKNSFPLTIIVLDIEDRYDYMEPELVKTLELEIENIVSNYFKY